MKKDLLKRIVQNPEIMLGKPVIEGTRLPVEILVEKVAYGYSNQDILKEYPFISEEDIKASLLYAAKVIRREEVYAI